MQRYFFTLRCGSLVFPDREGQVLDGLTDLESVAHAQVAAREPSATALALGCVVEVLDDRRELILEVPIPHR